MSQDTITCPECGRESNADFVLDELRQEDAPSKTPYAYHCSYCGWPLTTEEVKEQTA